MALTSCTIRAEHQAFGGRQIFAEHVSAACGGPMRFSVYLPPSASDSTPAPAVYFLAGLTCTEETFATKGGAQKLASALGLAIVTCDTSPRAARYPGDDEHWDFGLGAGFYLNAKASPWAATYNMETYVVEELRCAVESNFPVRRDRRGLFGHSMGGHGALVLSLRHPDLYTSTSAFAPIVAPSQVPWGQKAFERYLGERDSHAASWEDHDAVELLKMRRVNGTILVDQGLGDKFLERELRPHLLQEACAKVGQALVLRMHDGYDHGYYFIATFVDDHLRHHAKALLML